ncbi:signal peptidase II [Demequina sp. NBRC 110057]|uniref:signal peptidase II n=1 Tax=Demequina sp. NBRC 110057 TaxID=1570346 RepID=UPI0011778CD4|nr:signal peptidase II [Demequina sp. NBRC 110057]
MTWRPAFWLVALAVLVADQATKIWALNTLEPGEPHEVIGQFLQIQLTFNSGAAFSLGADYTWIVTLVMVAITIGLIWYARRAASTLAVWLFGIALGGALGNLIDRLFREPGFGRGHVVDMINYNGWFIGNVADIAIVGVAIAMLIVTFLGGHLLDGPGGDDAEAAPVSGTDTVGDGGDEATTASADAPSPATPEAGIPRG